MGEASVIFRSDGLCAIHYRIHPCWKGALSREQPQTTMENIESNVRAWADKFSLGIQKQTDDKFNFVYLIAQKIHL
jgi:hypothetical protein